MSHKSTALPEIIAKDKHKTVKRGYQIINLTNPYTNQSKNPIGKHLQRKVDAVLPRGKVAERLRKLNEEKS